MYKTLAQITNRMPGVLTKREAAKVLGVSPDFIGRVLPCQELFFVGQLATFLASIPPMAGADRGTYLTNLSTYFEAAYPSTMHTIHNLGESTASHRKYFSLSKVANKKHGFLYYVRYHENGAYIPSRWNTYTNNIDLANEFAVENRSRILKEWHEKHDAVNADTLQLYRVLREYYAPSSKLLEESKLRGRHITEKRQRTYHSIVVKEFIPFLTSKNVRTLKDITVKILVKWQKTFLSKGLAADTVNTKLNVVSTIFDHFVLEGYLEDNIFRLIPAIKRRSCDAKVTGCYELEKLYGAFSTPWKDEQSFLLCACIYSTGLRNSEIARVRPIDITTVDGVHFIDVNESKTESGIRSVPLHPLLRSRLLEYARTRGVTDTETIFKRTICNDDFQRANLALAEQLGTTDTIKADNIRFYSGRHFYKTLLSAHSLGAIEEIFMGHRVSTDVAKLYNHHDKQGKERRTAKAKKAVQILDSAFFTRMV
jgi:integrase